VERVGMRLIIPVMAGGRLSRGGRGLFLRNNLACQGKDLEYWIFKVQSPGHSAPRGDRPGSGGVFLPAGTAATGGRQIIVRTKLFRFYSEPGREPRMIICLFSEKKRNKQIGGSGLIPVLGFFIVIKACSRGILGRN
jgi:hypothetical protein